MIVTKTIKPVKPRVFTKHDISQFFGIQPTRVTNWEAGRTLKLKPSILEASGRGTRNLYSVGDVYKTGLAILLLAVGYSSKVVQRAVDAAPGHIEHAKWMFIEYPSGSQEPRIRWSRKPPLMRADLAHGHIVNLANIRKSVDELMANRR
jgi:hypothetical protein